MHDRKSKIYKRGKFYKLLCIFFFVKMHDLLNQISTLNWIMHTITLQFSNSQKVF